MINTTKKLPPGQFIIKDVEIYRLTMYGYLDFKGYITLCPQKHAGSINNIENYVNKHRWNFHRNWDVAVSSKYNDETHLGITEKYKEGGYPMFIKDKHVLTFGNLNKPCLKLINIDGSQCHSQDCRNSEFNFTGNDGDLFDVEIKLNRNGENGKYVGSTLLSLAHKKYMGQSYKSYENVGDPNYQTELIFGGK